MVAQNPKVGFELDTGFEIWEEENACDFSAGFQSVIGTGRMSMVDDYEDKTMALMAIMATITGKNTWKFSEKMIDAVAVFRLKVEEISCKEHIK